MNASHVLTAALAASAVVASPALAAPPAADIQAALDSDAGWEVHKLDAKGEVDVYKKTIPGLDVPGFKGIKIVDVDPDALFDAIIDIAHQAGISEDIPLKESHVLASSGTTIDFWQYLDVPGWTLANDRYWFCRGNVMRNHGGSRHHKWTWDKLPASQFPEAWKKAKAIDEDAVETELNHGSWEVVPQQGGGTMLIYRVVSAPGGTLPKAAQSLATGTTLPDNLLQFEAWTKQRTGR